MPKAPGPPTRSFFVPDLRDPSLHDNDELSVHPSFLLTRGSPAPSDALHVSAALPLLSDAHRLSAIDFFVRDTLLQTRVKHYCLVAA